MNICACAELKTLCQLSLNCLVIGENPYKNAFNVKVNKSEAEELGGVELLPLSKISKYFSSQPANKYIHIIIQYPVKTKEVHCTATYRHETKDEHIIINCECGSEKEIICLVDEDLMSVIWTQGFKVDLPIIVDTSDSYIDLSRFDGELANITNYEKILEHVLKDIAMKHKTCIHIISANKTTRCEFISSVLYSVASCYDSEVKVCPKYELSGSYGKEPVDWVIKIKDMIIIITETKREDINQGGWFFAE
ncbi:hypothetical protein C1645_744135 [Glomus cerebriforme]|uniref:Uncharacterized protein n=1 Tax=Glomus cerebriforme TaxID=658196 RepID=A0A397SHK2_9GLOM|nr:hypothetical protein C1645_744135 [Glomus cerebriforme]